MEVYGLMTYASIEMKTKFCVERVFGCRGFSTEAGWPQRGGGLRVTNIGRCTIAGYMVGVG